MPTMSFCNLMLRSAAPTYRSVAARSRQPWSFANAAAASRSMGTLRKPVAPTNAEAVSSAARIHINSVSSSNKPKGKVLTLDSLNPSVKQAEYAVRGELAIRAEQLRAQLEAGKGAHLPFNQITNCNIGNPQQLNQQPISFLRQVSALLEYPPLLDPRNEDLVLKMFPKDAIERARSMAQEIGSVGSYSHSQGIPAIRRSVAKFIQDRDGFPSDPDQIFLTAGASPGVQTVLQAIISHPNVGILIPIPQYPLYTATIGLCNGVAVPYYLDEKAGWSVHADEVRRAVVDARAQGTDVRALCIINPGNPTGNVLSRKDMQDLVQVCVEEKLVLVADEVYQTNVYDPERKPWFSFKKVVREMGLTEKDIELVSFHSISKGMLGECGRRGGYFECFGIEPEVKEQLYKIASISLCPNVQGQVAVDLMVNPPQPGSESYDLYSTEMTYLFESLKRRATKLAAAFNQLEGVSCQPAEGAMYLFPRIHLPAKAEAAAQAAGKPADAFYVMALLEATGVCMVPGSGFLQEPGTWHFRCTFLPPEDQLDEFIGKVGKFHQQFMDKYRD
ncbi:pyridoxal phosphate-dependent transferase [Catenaria anguillulae PL171]|uniref:Glutamate pyruvate transaminase n=1 Tax=Catenaria anguillulae PL171 TaxID=765915 RepID=A0A1Y2H5Z6_9FUNG|nr:pyridoxal phosphate-dependent transferase [Catenaria anguillulae PL171]